MSIAMLVVGCYLHDVFDTLNTMSGTYRVLLAFVVPTVLMGLEHVYFFGIFVLFRFLLDLLIYD